MAEENEASQHAQNVVRVNGNDVEYFNSKTVIGKDGYFVTNYYDQKGNIIVTHDLDGKVVGVDTIKAEKSTKAPDIQTLDRFKLNSNPSEQKRFELVVENTDSAVPLPRGQGKSRLVASEELRTKPSKVETKGGVDMEGYTLEESPKGFQDTGKPVSEKFDLVDSNSSK